MLRAMNLLATSWGRLTAFFLLYVTEGLPLGFAAGAIAVYMRREGVGVDEMGAFMGALYAPWGFKWAFGPVVDLLGVKSLGHRRGWILFAQTIMILGLLGSSFVDYSDQLALFTWVMVAVNGFCALQDVAIDALAVSSLKEEERGVGNGLMFAGAYIGQALGGSGMLYLASYTGSLAPAFYAVAGMVAVVWGTTLLFMREDPEVETMLLDSPDPGLVVREIWAYVRTGVQSFLANPAALAAAVFAFLPASAMALGLALQAALAVEVGLSDEQIATLGLVGAVAAAAGSVSGGWISDRTGHRRTLAVYVLLSLIPTAALGLVMHRVGWIEPVAPDQDGREVLPLLVDTFWYATVVYGFFTGLTYGTRMAIFMKVCDPKVAATQFTLYMAMSNLAISYTSWWQGISVERWGYPTTLALDCAAGVVCLAVLPLIKPRPDEPDETVLPAEPALT
ncbi:MAG: MFS transporter [Deltaproteobacteria bacterium]|nr:MAG: MFS transporter [Deltaproteobacteria bacterium]